MNSSTERDNHLIRGASSPLNNLPNNQTITRALEWNGVAIQGKNLEEEYLRSTGAHAPPGCAPPPRPPRTRAPRRPYQRILNPLAFRTGRGINVLRVDLQSVCTAGRFLPRYQEGTV